MVNVEWFKEILGAEQAEGPFWVAVAAVLLQGAPVQTDRAKRIYRFIRRQWPTPAALEVADDEDLELILQSAGRASARILTLQAVCQARMNGKLRSAADIPREWGYWVKDAFLVLVDRDLVTRPSTKEFQEYVDVLCWCE